MKKTVYLKIIIIVLFSTFGRAIMFSVAAPNGTTEMVSVASDGTQGNDVSFNSSISADGRYVVFGSYASNLVGSDTNDSEDVFLHDRQTGETTRVSVASDGTQGNSHSDTGYSGYPIISIEGRYVVFSSVASNLVNGDTNNTDDVFIHDRQTGQTTRVSISSSGIQGNDFSTGASISADGRYVAFQSEASNLVSNDTNNAMDIFIHDRQTSETTRVSVASDGTEANGFSAAPYISDDGRYVAFCSMASNLVSNDTNNAMDIFVHDRQTSETTRVSVASDGTEANGMSSNYATISSGGRFIGFSSEASNLVSGDTNGVWDVFIHDRQGGQTTRVSVSSSGIQGNNVSAGGAFSADARYVTFWSQANNLVSGDTNICVFDKGFPEPCPDVFVHDRQTSQTTRVAISSSGVEANNLSLSPSISTDGGYIVFTSLASNLVNHDTNGVEDIFVHDKEILPLDLSIDSVSPVQVLEGQELVRGKVTAIKAVIRKSGSGTAGNVSARASVGGYITSRFYVAEAANLDPQHALRNDNSIYPLSFGPNETVKAIYFFSDRFTPTSSTFQVSIKVDYLEDITETNETNNEVTPSPVPVYDTKWSGILFPDLYIHYFRTDWGNTPLTIFDTYYQTTNDFFRGVYPVSAQRFTPSISTILGGNTTRFRGGDGKLDISELGRWAFDKLGDMRIAHPTADRFVATVPPGWFSQNTTGVLTNAVGIAYPLARELVIAEASVPGHLSSASTVAHEIGHSYQLDIGCEEYDQNCDGVPDRIGLFASPGLWVDKKIPIQVPLQRDIYCFMGGAADVEYWIDGEDYSKLINDHKAATNVATMPDETTPAILALGIFDTGGNVTLDNWYVLPEAELSVVPSGPYVFEYQDINGGVLHQLNFDVVFETEGRPLSESPFVYTIPYIADTTRIVIKHNSVSLGQKVVSANSPSVTLLSPDGGERLFGSAEIEWSGSDADGDNLSYTVLFSTDNGATWEMIIRDLTSTGYFWDVSALPAGAQYRIKILVTDGVNTGEDISDDTFSVLSGIFMPVILRNN